MKLKNLFILILIQSLITVDYSLNSMSKQEEIVPPSYHAVSSAIPPAENQKIKLESSDGQEVLISLEAAQQSETLKHLIEDIGREDLISGVHSIPIPIDGKTLTTIVDLLEKIKGAPASNHPAILAEVIKYLPVSEHSLVLLGVNYLDIPDLFSSFINSLDEKLNKNQCQCWLKI